MSKEPALYDKQSASSHTQFHLPTRFAPLAAGVCLLFACSICPGQAPAPEVHAGNYAAKLTNLTTPRWRGDCALDRTNHLIAVRGNHRLACSFFARSANPTPSQIEKVTMAGFATRLGKSWVGDTDFLRGEQVGPEWKRYSFNYIVPATAQFAGMAFRISAGGSPPHAVILDDISLVDLDANNQQLMTNGDFEQWPGEASSSPSLWRSFAAGGAQFQLTRTENAPHPSQPGASPQTPQPSSAPSLSTLDQTPGPSSSLPSLSAVNTSNAPSGLPSLKAEPTPDQELPSLNVIKSSSDGGSGIPSLPAAKESASSGLPSLGDLRSQQPPQAEATPQPPGLNSLQPTPAPELSPLAWQTDVAKAWNEARQANRYLLIFFSSSSSPSASQLERDLSSDKNLRALIDEHYVAVRIDMDSQAELASRFQVTKPGSLTVYDAKGTGLLAINQPLGAEELLQKLKAL